jgi:hypothetical protein
MLEKNNETTKNKNSQQLSVGSKVKLIITGGTPGARIAARSLKDLPDYLKPTTKFYNVSTNYRDYEITRDVLGSDIHSIRNIFIKDNGFAGDRKNSENQKQALTPKIMEVLTPDIEAYDPDFIVVVYATGGGTAPIMEQTVREIRCLGSQTGGVPISEKIMEIVITPDGTATFHEENSRKWLEDFQNDRWRHAYLFSNRQNVTTLSQLNTRLLRPLITIMYQFISAMEAVNFTHQFNAKVSLGTIGFAALDSGSIPKELLTDKAQQIARDAFMHPLAGIDPKTYRPLLRVKKNIFALATARDDASTEDVKRGIDAEITNFTNSQGLSTNITKLSAVQLIKGWPEISVTLVHDVMEEDVASFLGANKSNKEVP